MQNRNISTEAGEPIKRGLNVFATLVKSIRNYNVRWAGVAVASLLATMALTTTLATTFALTGMSLP